jgi:hypothetical protein
MIQASLALWISSFAASAANYSPNNPTLWSLRESGFRSRTRQCPLWVYHRISCAKADIGGPDADNAEEPEAGEAEPEAPDLVAAVE